MGYQQLVQLNFWTINSRFQQFFRLVIFGVILFLWHSLNGQAMMIKVDSYAFWDQTRWMKSCFTNLGFAQMGSWINLWGFHRGLRLKPPPKGSFSHLTSYFGPTIPYWLNSDQGHVGLVMGQQLMPCNGLNPISQSTSKTDPSCLKGERPQWYAVLFFESSKKAAMFTCKKVNQDGDSMHAIGSTYSKSRVAPILYRPFTRSPHHTVDVDIFRLSMLFSSSQLIEWSWSYFTSRFLKCWASFWGVPCQDPKLLSSLQVEKKCNSPEGYLSLKCSIRY